MARLNALTLILSKVRSHGRGYPFATNLSLVSIPIGLLAIGIGPDISRGFANLFQSPWPVYMWGTVLLIGGVNVAVGIGRNIPSKERAGLYVLSIAYAFYGVSVIIGLGVNGLVTGPVFVTLSWSCVQRARVIMANAREAARLLAQIGDELADKILIDPTPDRTKGD